MRVVVGLAVVAALIMGCKDQADEPATAIRPAPMPEPEMTRARAACDDLVARLCACSAAHPDNAELADRCQIKHAKPEALALALEAAADMTRSDDTIRRAQASARKIVGKCIEEVAALPSLGCQ
jgi:hypothetical protein